MPRDISTTPKSASNIPTLPPIPGPRKGSLDSNPPIPARRASTEQTPDQTPRRSNLPKRLSHEFSSGSFTPRGSQYAIMHSLLDWHGKEKIESLIRRHYQGKNIYIIEQRTDHSQKGFLVHHSTEGELVWDKINSFLLLLRKSKIPDELIQATLSQIDQLPWAMKTKSPSNVALLARIFNSADIHISEPQVALFLAEENILFIRKIFDAMILMQLEQPTIASLWESIAKLLLTLKDPIIKIRQLAKIQETVIEIATNNKKAQDAAKKIGEFIESKLMVIPTSGNQNSLLARSKTRKFEKALLSPHSSPGL